MKLTHVSVMKKLSKWNPEEDFYVQDNTYIISAELESLPPQDWFKHFKAAWVSASAPRRLSPDIRLKSNALLLPYTEPDKVEETLETLRNVFTHIRSLNSVTAEKAILTDHAAVS